MQTYFVTYRVEAHFLAAVDAENLEEALKSAEGRFQDASFGEAKDIEGEAIVVEDWNGNFIWEK